MASPAECRLPVRVPLYPTDVIRKEQYPWLSKSW
jgi:hypothetical protein